MSIAASLDLVNTTFAEFSGPLTRSFVKAIPTLDALLKAKKGKYDGGTYIERDFTSTASAVATPVRSGTERIRTRYIEGIKKLRVEPARMVVTVVIPNMYIKVNMGKQAVLSLIKEHPLTNALAYAADWNKYFLTGTTDSLLATAADMLSFVQLNGTIAGAGIGVGVLNGIMDFVVPASQTDVVFDVAKSTTYYHYNQYGAVTSWATNGPKVLKATARRAANFSMSRKTAGLVVMDPDVYSNWEEFCDAKIRTVKVEDPTSKSTGNTLPFLDGWAVCDNDLDRSLFSGTGANGVTYGLDLDEWEVQFTNAANLDGILKFSPFQDAGINGDFVYSKAELQGNMICRKLASQWCVGGGAA